MGLGARREATVPAPHRDSVKAIMSVLQRWQGSPVPVTGYNDWVAVAGYRAAARLGLKVPEDLAVIGVDDEPFAAPAGDGSPSCAPEQAAQRADHPSGGRH